MTQKTKLKTLATALLLASSLLAISLLATACGAPSEAPGEKAAAGKAAAAAVAAAARESSEPPFFVEVTDEAGLHFVHENGMSGERYFVEITGSGAALSDLDGDGDLDAVLVQGRVLVPAGREPPRPDESAGSRVFRNDLVPGGEPRFVDVTDESGLEADGYGMGVAAGDVDNDGRPDLYFTNFGANQLWRNTSTAGAIRFENVTATGLDDDRWSTSASFTDLDGDGWLDLYVVNYVDFRLETHRSCRSPGGRQDYCGPQSYDGEGDRLLRGRGSGVFEDVTASAGMLGEPSSGLGVVAADFDLDGRVDLYVANDLRRNLLWRQLPPEDGELRFENVALESGAAVSMLGRAQASMGVVAGDVDNDGDDDLFMTHLRADTNTLYVNNGEGHFDDRSAPSGLGAASLATTGFGTALIDVDNDGWLDLVAANGAVKVIESQALGGETFPLKQPNQLFLNRGDGTFQDASGAAGEAMARLEVSRGVAVGDVDNDGRSDVLLTNNHGPARLLLGRASVGNAWIGLRLLTRDGRDALGARVAVERPGAPPLWRRAATDGSYLSSSDPRVLVGLGSAPEVARVRVHWPGGDIETWSGLEAGRYHRLVAGEGEPEADER